MMPHKNNCKIFSIRESRVIAHVHMLCIDKYANLEKSQHDGYM